MSHDDFDLDLRLGELGGRGAVAQADPRGAPDTDACGADPVDAPQGTFVTCASECFVVPAEAEDEDAGVGDDVTRGATCAEVTCDVTCADTCGDDCGGDTAVTCAETCGDACGGDTEITCGDTCEQVTCGPTCEAFTCDGSTCAQTCEPDICRAG